MKRYPAARLLLLILLVVVAASAFGEGLVSCSIEDDRFTDPGNVIVKVDTNGENIYAVRDEDGKALTIDRKTGLCSAYVSETALERGTLILHITLGKSDGESYIVELPVRQVTDDCAADLFVVFPDRVLYEGETVPVRYEIVNRGEFDLTGILLTCEDGSSQSIDSLLPGERFSFVVYRVIGTDTMLSLSAKVHSGFSGKEVIRESGAVTPELAKENIKLSTVYDANVIAGNSARVTLNIENTGNTSITECVLKCDGVCCDCNLPYLIKPGDFITLSLKTPLLTEDSVISYTLEGKNGNGTSCVISTEAMDIQVTPSEDMTEEEQGEPQRDNGSFKRNAVMSLIRMNGITGIALAAAGIICVVMLILLAAGYKKKQDKSER